MILKRLHLTYTLHSRDHLCLEENEDCEEKVRDAGCPEYEKHVIRFLNGEGHSLASCRRACSSTADCKIIIYGNDGGGSDGACGLYKDSARTGCSVKQNEIEKFTMYSVGECSSNKKGLF